MRNPPLILVVDDTPDNVEVLQMRLESKGYAVATAADGEEALARIAELTPDLVLLDVMMPKVDGYEVCRRIKADPELKFIPVVMITAKSDRSDVVAGLEAGAEDYLVKPVDPIELVARVRSMLRIKALQDDVRELNAGLEKRVQEQVAEIERMSELRRFLAPEIADLLLADGGLKRLESHRSEITVLFCDLRGFTAFSETAEPEDIMRVLGEYHGAIGPIVTKYEGTINGFDGDGVIVFFNDPRPVPDAPQRAVLMADEMRRAVKGLSDSWRKRGFKLGFGVGITQGYATLGRIGFEGRFDYTAIGTVVNLAARMCGEAKDGEILVTRKVVLACEDIGSFSEPEERSFKGISRSVDVCNLLALHGPSAQAAQ